MTLTVIKTRKPGCYNATLPTPSSFPSSRSTAMPPKPPKPFSATATSSTSNLSSVAKPEVRFLGCNASSWRRKTGCVVTHALIAEPTIRLILVACHLSSTLRNTSALTPQPQHNTNAQPPLLDFWQHSLKKALDEDPFWGPDLWRTFTARAKALEHGIEELVKQCIEFAPLALANAAVAIDDDESPPQSPKSSAALLKLPHGAGVGVKEQNDYIPSVVLGCWTTLLADAEEAKRYCLSPSTMTKNHHHHPIFARSLSSS
ncbi:MAG: hypothetical protein Q9200_005159 [Gallowayella weberi]